MHIVPGINQHYLPRDDGMMKLMKQDLSYLDRLFGSDNKSFIPGSITFTRVSASDVFVFKHVRHVACSSVTLTELEHVVTRKPPVAARQKAHSCEFCYNFLPYVCDNQNLADRVEFEDHRMFKEHRDLPQCPKNSPFYVQFNFFGTGHLYSKNIWSQRLTNSLNEFYFVKGFQYSAQEALQFDDHQYQYTRLEGPYTAVYFFRGTPDIRFKVKRVINFSDSDDGDDNYSSENDSFEAKVQPPKLSHVPEKLGELIASMYLSVQFKTMKKVLNEKSLRASYSSKGLFVTRTTGVFGVTLNMPLIKASDVDQPSRPSVDCVDFGNFCLTHNQLCYIFQRFLLNNTKEILAANTESGELSEQEEGTIALEEPGEGRSPKRKKTQ